jgi:hypothetical protein
VRLGDPPELRVSSKIAFLAISVILGKMYSCPSRALHGPSGGVIAKLGVAIPAMNSVINSTLRLMKPI